MSNLAQAIHDSGYQMVLAVTGGGVGAIHELLTTPGASRSILEASAPYANEALAQFLGGKPDQFCSSATARAMAMASFERAKKLAARSESKSRGLLGIGCTASLVSDRPKRGDHRFHLAIQSGTCTEAYSLKMKKGWRARLEEDQLVSAVILGCLHAAVTHSKWAWQSEHPDESLVRDHVIAPLGWQKLLAGECRWTNRDGSLWGETLSDDPRPKAIYCGAFNPRHIGHRQIARIGQDRFGEVSHEICIRNVDKPPLDFLEMAARLGQFEPHETVIFSNAPTFAEKSRVFPSSLYLVGLDTIRRIDEPRYYGGESARDLAISQLAERGCRFLVFGRVVDGAFQAFSPSDVSPTLARLCEVVSEQEFRQDISSSDLRTRQASG